MDSPFSRCAIDNSDDGYDSFPAKSSLTSLFIESPKQNSADHQSIGDDTVANKGGRCCHREEITAAAPAGSIEYPGKGYRQRLWLRTVFACSGLSVCATLAWGLPHFSAINGLASSSVAVLAGCIAWRFWLRRRRANTPLETLIHSVARQSAAIEKTLHRDKHWQRFTAGMLVPLHFEPAAGLRGAMAHVSAIACIERLTEYHESWQRERLKQRQRELRRHRLDLTVALLDYGLDDLSVSDHALLNAPAVYTEHLLIHVAPRAAVLDDVLALFARRIWLALQSLAPNQRRIACAQWDIVQMLWEFSSDMRGLSERSLLISALAQQSKQDSEKQQIADVLAHFYRRDLAIILTRAEKIALADRHLLSDALLAQCEETVTGTMDDLAYVHATQPIHPFFCKFYAAHLAALVAIADDVEKQQGVRPLTARLRQRQSVT